MPKDFFKEKLESKGINLSDEDIKDLKETAATQLSMDRVTPILDRKMSFHYLTLVCAYVGAIEDLSEIVERNVLLRQQLKYNFNKMVSCAKDVKQSYLNLLKEDEQMRTAFLSYIGDFADVLYNHLNHINNHDDIYK
jgi:hypothetical protein